MVVIRISNHRTHLQTWADRYPKNLHPSKKITKRMGRNLPIIFRQKAFYSFVFEDEPSQNDTNVRDGRIITVYESVKQSRDIKDGRQLILIGEALSTFISNQEQYDEQILGKLQPITNKIQENKTTKDMKKQTIKLNESQLREIIKESINDMLLNEYGEQQNTTNEPNSQLLAMFVQESEQLRRSLAQFQDTARQIRQESMQLQNTVGFIQKFGNNLNTFGQQFMNYCNNFLNKLQPQQQRQQQQPMQQNNTN